MRRWLVAFLPVLLWAAPGWADVGSWAYGCKFTTPTGTTAVNSERFDVSDYSVGCYRWTDADGAGTQNAPLAPNGVLTPVQVTAQSALICFDPDILQAVTTTARVIPHHCPAGFIADTANPLRSCISLGELVGTEGDAATQDTCVRVGPGAYIFEVSVECATGDTCQISVKAEGL